MTSATPKTVWRTTNIPQDIHDDGKLVAALEKRPLGEILGEILAPVLKQRVAAAMKENGFDLKSKRQAVAMFKRQNNGGKQ